MSQNKNEVVVVKSNVLSVESKDVQIPDFNNVNIGEEPRRLKINVRKAKKPSGELFNSITGYAKLPVYDGDTFVGVKVKRMSVHFRKTAFKGSTNVHTPEDLKSGYLYVKAKGLRIPNVYKVTEKLDKDGNVMYNENGEAILKYPEIWVESDVLGLMEFVTSQSALDVDGDDNVIDGEASNVNPETGEVIEDDIKEAVADLENETPDDEETAL